MPEGHLWPFLRMRNSKIRQKIAEANPAKTWSIRQKFMSKRKQVMYNFANKVVDYFTNVKHTVNTISELPRRTARVPA